MADQSALTEEQQRELALKDVRRTNAIQAEANAWSQRVYARQWEILAASDDPSVIQGSDQSQQYARQADEHRARADAMNELAGTTLEHSRPVVVQQLRSLRDAFARSLIEAEDAEAHPEAYGSRHNQGPTVQRAGIQAVDELLAELESPPKASAAPVKNADS